VSTEVPLKDASILCSVKKGTPPFKLTHAVRGFLRMEFRHSGIREVLSTAHGVSKVYTPAVPFINIRQSGSDSTFCHDGVCFTEQGFADEPDSEVAYGGFNSGTKTSTTGSNYQYIIFMRFVRCHANVSSFFSTIDVF
jgi:hypothetical protein